MKHFRVIQPWLNFANKSTGSTDMQERRIVQLYRPRPLCSYSSLKRASRQSPMACCSAYSTLLAEASACLRGRLGSAYKAKGIWNGDDGRLLICG